MTEKKTADSSRPVPPRRRPGARRHGYRGYGSAFAAASRGSVHWGRGFGGVDPLETGGSALPRVEIFSED